MLLRRVAAAAAVALCSEAHAADWKGYGSAGAGLLPDYVGSKRYEALPYLEFRLNRGNYYARFEGGALRFNLLDGPNLHFGPMFGIRRGRHTVGSPQVSAMHHLDDTETAGAFLEWENVGKDPRWGQDLTLFAGDAVIGERSGWDVTLRASARMPLMFIDPGFIASAEADASWGSGPFMRTYFGVNAQDAAASGLPAFAAKSGFESVGAAIAFDQFLSRHWSVGMRLHYGRLVGNAAQSPVTAIAGSPDQYFVGIVGGYAL